MAGSAEQAGSAMAYRAPLSKWGVRFHSAEVRSYNSSSGNPLKFGITAALDRPVSARLGMLGGGSMTLGSTTKPGSPEVEADRELGRLEGPVEGDRPIRHLGRATTG